MRNELREEDEGKLEGEEGMFNKTLHGCYW